MKYDCRGSGLQIDLTRDTCRLFRTVSCPSCGKPVAITWLGRLAVHRGV